ncbi:GNS1/SUR4 family-domain-containing protein [Dipodascopsis tothii]|uniref:GNS1/SUR4 family-domain-containing protein n=1 Tax=Dipodascopsis tothii TaxID=44089 RepID=UPI0034CED713
MSSYRSVSNVSTLISSPPSSIVFSLPMGLDMPQGPPDGSLFAESFNWLMDVRVPVTIATVYATAVHVLNRSRGAGTPPARFATTALFKWLVIAHNLGLCVYSAWTCVGMTSSLIQTVLENKAGGRDSSLWRSLCSLDGGIWDKGLSYYGFLFYLSKFYEVLDTAIILAKGKKSSLLQTYHHAGAMMSMWAGIRFASPPIWIFVVFNSLIHTLMYFYYTLSGINVRVPRALKRALTTAQICQFVFGGSLAISHFFIYYFDPSQGEYTSCLVNPGQTFALFVNVAYLAPLTYLFVGFWIDSYVRNRKAPLAGKAAPPLKGKSKPAAAKN